MSIAQTYSEQSLRTNAKDLLSHAIEHSSLGLPFDLLVAATHVGDALELFLKYCISSLFPELKQEEIKEMNPTSMLKFLPTFLPWLDLPRALPHQNFHSKDPFQEELRKAYRMRNFAVHAALPPQNPNLIYNIELVGDFVNQAEAQLNTEKQASSSRMAKK